MKLLLPLFSLFISLPLFLGAQTSPDAPTLQLSNSGTGSITLSLSNSPLSNNFQDQFEFLDPNILVPNSVNGIALTAEEKVDYATFHFQGYVIYQFAHSGVGPQSIDDSRLVREIAQTDLADDVGTLSNFQPSGLGLCWPSQMVQAENLGLEHQFHISIDAFTGQPLQEGQTYCFQAIAYAHNANKTLGNCVLPAPFLGTDPAKMIASPGCITLSPNSTNSSISARPELSIATDPATRSALVTADVSGTVRILDLTGKLVQDFTVQPSVTVRSSSLPAGLYLLQMESDFHGEATRKLVIP